MKTKPDYQPNGYGLSTLGTLAAKGVSRVIVYPGGGSKYLPFQAEVLKVTGQEEDPSFICKPDKLKIKMRDRDFSTGEEFYNEKSMSHISLGNGTAARRLP